MRLDVPTSRAQRGLSAALATACLALIAPGLAHAGAFVPPGLIEGAKASPSQKLHLIVVAAPGVSTGWIKNEAMKDSRGNQFGAVRREFKIIDALAVDLTGKELLTLAARDGIHSITPDGATKKDSAFVPSQLWPLAVGADRLWSTPDRLAPQPPTIAIVDSGVGDRPLDFGGRVIDRVAFTSVKMSDDLGHGTLVAAIAAGSASAYPGAAPNANIISLRVVDRDARSLVSDVLAAADWIFENRISKGIGVVNFSLRTVHPNYGLYDPINLAVERLWTGGTVVVASAGNNGNERMLYAPASDPFVITVGAADLMGTVDATDDVNAPWSSYGYTAEGFAKPDVVAPGRRLVGPVPDYTALWKQFWFREQASEYLWMSGTSFAAPVVAGAAAQILARHPDWTPDQVKGALMLTARALPGAAPMSVGVGEIDVAAAAALESPPNPNENLLPFVRTDTQGDSYFDAKAWNAEVSTDPDWTSATWTSATWTSNAWSDATWTSATWTSATWTSATWTSATWTSATWTSSSAVE